MGGGGLETRCIATQAPQATGQRGIRSHRRRGASKSHYLRLRHGFLRDTWPEHIGCFQSLNTRNNATSLIFTHSFAERTKRLLRAGRCAGGAHARECSPGSPGGLAPARCLLPCLAHAAVLMVLVTPRRHQRARGRLAPFFFFSQETRDCIFWVKRPLSTSWKKKKKTFEGAERRSGGTTPMTSSPPLSFFFFFFLGQIKQKQNLCQHYP